MSANGDSTIGIRVDVCGKRIMEYVTECLAKFNCGANQIKIRGIAGNLSKGVEVAQILNSAFQIECSAWEMSRIEIESTRVSCLEAVLSCYVEPNHNNADISFFKGSNFTEFPIYNLLLDSLLCQKEQINISMPDGKRLLNIVKSDCNMTCECQALSDDSQTLDGLTSVYYRSGLILSPYWRSVARELARFDAVIIGVDTNILLDAALTEHLVNSLTLIDPVDYVHTPNWMLIVIPSAVMHELEQRANHRDSKGALTERGRTGFRALQEIIELDQSSDVPEIELIVTGEANPVLDTRVELRYLRDELRREPSVAVPVFKPLISSGDMVVRDQLKHFLRQIDFHKGVYFLTSDKTNAALAKTEGLQSIYYRQPVWRTAKGRTQLPQISSKLGSEAVTIIVPLGKLIYELTVQFGSIEIGWDSERIEISCDRRGENLDHWFLKDLRIDGKGLEKLAAEYAPIARFSLHDISMVWRNFNMRLAKLSGSEFEEEGEE